MGQMGGFTDDKFKCQKGTIIALQSCFLCTWLLGFLLKTDKTL